MVYPGFSDLDAPVRQMMIEGVDVFVRKSAHFAEYTVLGFLLAWDFWPIRKKKRVLQLILAILIGFLNACFDEIHQMFVPGRAGMIGDVLLDTAGVTVGAFLGYILIHLGHSRHSRYTQSE